MIYPPSRFFKVQEALSTVILSLVSMAEGAGVWRKAIWRAKVVERVNGPHDQQRQNQNERIISASRETGSTGYIATETKRMQ
jgi:hypothetical protein